MHPKAISDVIHWRYLHYHYEQGTIVESVEFETRPQKSISEEAQSIHGIANEQASSCYTPPCQQSNHDTHAHTLEALLAE